ncbi:MAG: hypothetical protein M3552_01265 [Planctomycetota bacterium]|nr:hypothetical protein [Planctomycetaceae bacterium]MDQ3329275.1 hypothetical protein [Planctomycetota bacterium]
MSLRSDKVAGAITCVFGIVMIGFASFFLLVMTLQRHLILGMPSLRQSAKGDSVIEAMHAIHGVWFTYLPLTIVGGICFALAGFQIHRGSRPARRVAQATAIGGYIWIIAYAISCYRILDVIGAAVGAFPESANEGFRWLTLAGTAIFAAFPTSLLYLLSRPQSDTATTSVEPTEPV